MMQEIPKDDAALLRRHYRHFAEHEAAGLSELYVDWAHGVADDQQTLTLLHQLPAPKRQANLLFAAARIHGTPLIPWDEARQVVHRRWGEVSKTMRNRSTQTNEPGRVAVLNHAFERISQQSQKPLALIEVGTSAGLCLYPDAWPIRYTPGGTLSPAGTLVAEVELDCALEGITAPQKLPEVVWRAGIDLNPLDLRSSEDREWLEALIWPGMEHRLQRLAAGARLVAAQPPTLFAGDLNERLSEALEQVPAGATPVVFHSAVLVYLSEEDRRRFREQVTASAAQWVSNEGMPVFPDIAAKLPQEDPERSGFILSLNGEPLARTGPHGQYLRALKN